jgi:hypothetical protein
MGNTSSDSLGHSFKRLRLSEMQEISHSSPSPSLVSPKRKVISTIGTSVKNDICNHTVNVVNSETPVIQCNDVVHSSAVASSILQSSNIHPTNDCDVLLSLQNDHSFVTQTHITSVSEKNPEHNFLNLELSDEEIIMCLRSRKIASDLSDADILVCLKHAYASQDR